VGCRVCRETGYMGRSGVYELLMTDSTVRHMCVERATSGDILQYGLKKGLKTLRQSGYEKCRQGTTSLEEVLRVTKGTSF
jgi:type II secretory ATPase GspE/PulE/Tfp pilus assembly ATPase PilB-like protein